MTVCLSDSPRHCGVSALKTCPTLKVYLLQHMPQNMHFDICQIMTSESFIFEIILCAKFVGTSSVCICLCVGFFCVGCQKMCTATTTERGSSSSPVCRLPKRELVCLVLLFNPTVIFLCEYDSDYVEVACKS